MTKVRQYNQAIISQAMGTNVIREDTIIKPSVLRQLQPKPIQKTL